MPTKGYFDLLKSLVLDTGKVAREYVEGKRKKYFPPLNFYLIVAGLLVLTMTTLEKKASPDVLKENPELNEITDLVKKERVIGIYKRKAEAMHFTNQYSNLLAFSALPIIALIYWLLYIKAHYNYIEHMVAGMYMIGLTNLFYLLIFIPITRVLIGDANSPYIAVFFLAQLVYNGIFYYYFINRKGKAALAKAFGVTLLTIAVWGLLTSSLIGLYISNGFWGLVH